jgi:hypothetical protein
VTDPRAPAGGVRAQLTNFDIDVDALKPEHKRFLDREVVPILTGPSARVWLQGQASHTGTAAHNLELSHRRALRTAEYLEGRGVADARIQVDWVGDSLAGSARREVDAQRAVSLMAAPLAPLPGPPQPPPPAPAPAPGLPKATGFQLRVLGALSGGVRPVAVESVFIQIWDDAHSLSCIYLYRSVGLGRGWGTPLSTTLSGPWNRFATTGPLAVDQFAGPARFTTAGAGPYTWNYLNMMGLPPGVATLPNPLPLETGFTVGLGASSTAGVMSRGFCGPFAGP